MNILHLVQSFDISGRSRVIYDLNSSLNKDGFQSFIVSLTDNCGFLSAQNKAKCLRLNKKEGFSLFAIFKLVRIIKEKKISVIHTHGKGALLYAVITKKLTGVNAHIHTIHRSDGDIFTNNRLLKNLIAHYLDRAIGVSNSACLSFIKSYDFPANKTLTIYNGIDIAKYSEAPISRLVKELKDNGKLTIGTVMNFAPHKDYDTLISAFSELLKTHPDAKLIIVGDGPKAEEIKKFVEVKGFSGNVKFLGFRNDVPSLLKTFDIFVLSSHTEGLSVALLEAMASKVPVIASNLEGIKEVIEDGAAGKLFKHGDYEGLKNAIIQLLENKELRNSLTENAYERVKNNFSIEKMCDSYKAVYKN